jgi:hypothetical protein
MAAGAGVRMPTPRHPLADHRPSRTGSYADQAVRHDPAPRDQPRPAYRPLAPRPGPTKGQWPAVASQGQTDARADDRCGQLAAVLKDGPPRRITRSGRPAIHAPSHPRQRRSAVTRALSADLRRPLSVIRPADWCANRSPIPRGVAVVRQPPCLRADYPVMRQCRLAYFDHGLSRVLVLPGAGPGHDRGS